MNKIKAKFSQEVLEKQQVGLVVVFGSQAAGTKHPGSDIDIGVVFKDNSQREKNPVEVYGSLYEEFARNFKEKIDIVYLEEAPLRLQYQAIRNGIVLYQSSPSFFADYKEKVLKMYFDFKFVEDIFNQAILEPVK